MHEPGLEELVNELRKPEQLESYKKPFDDYKPSFVPRVLGKTLVWIGNTVYGTEPSYQKFRAVEVIARVPYHSWESAAYTLLTLFYSHEERAIRLSTISYFSRIAQDNETMHVVVITQLARAAEKSNPLIHTAIPMIFAFFYFWASYLLYLVNPRYSLELNYMFEQHAFEQYSKFLEKRGDELKKKPIASEFLTWYGRTARSEYEFFESVRNDEIIHRNRSICEIQLNKQARC